eukprot:COSAG06_NODE_377_length_16646_cov_21.984589_14_plen_50_part_00
MGISLDVFGNVSFGATLSLGAVNQLTGGIRPYALCHNSPISCARRQRRQ